MIPNKKTTKQLIVEAASELFMSLGFQATSTRMIADRVGITQPNLYHYFKNKEQIYLAVLEYLAVEVNQMLCAIIHDARSDLTEKLVQIVNALKDKHHLNLYIMRHDINHKISKDSHEKVYAIWRTAYLQPLIDLFEIHQSALHADLAPDVLARYYYATLAPYIHDEQGSFKGLQPEQIIKLFVHGIFKDE